MILHTQESRDLKLVHQNPIHNKKSLFWQMFLLTGKNSAYL